MHFKNYLLKLKLQKTKININNKKRSKNIERTIDDESYTIDTHIFDYNEYNFSKKNIENEENKDDHININRNKDWLKKIKNTNSFIFKENQTLNLFNRPKEILF